MSKPIFVCIPGPSHPAVVFDPLKAALSLHGYTAIPINLPSIGGNPPTYDFTEDVLAIRNLVTQIADSGADVVVVMHSWGGLAGCEALRGLGKEERARGGLRGGVSRLVFIMAWIPQEGFQSAPRGDVSAMFSYMNTDLQAGIATIDPEATVVALYNDLPSPQAQYWTSQLLPQSLGIFWSKTTYSPWRYIPSTYVICGQDQNVTAEYAEMMLQEAKDSTPNMIDTVERCEDAGHAVFLSRISWTVDMLRRAAGEQT
ncbi:Alpha/beta hydrolase fold-1 [Tricladium varicosporioides]|nr:Alpha/beta hydrolase fold-1 [Hymenoscyphus varicosporioides]